MNIRRIDVFGVKITPHSISEFVQIIDENLSGKREVIIQNGINAHVITCLQQSKKIRDAINNSQLVNIDGMSVAWALKFFGYKNIVKASCPDIFDKLIELADEKGYKIFLLGAKPDTIEYVVSNLKKKYPKLEIAGYQHGYFNKGEAEEIALRIKESKADMLFLGMSSPKKELFSDKYKELIQVPYVFGVGGLFDILSGDIKRAPEWIHNNGFEWLYRLIQEPRRLWSRYTIGVLKFLFFVLKEKLKGIV